MKTSHFLQKYLILVAVLGMVALNTLSAQCSFKGDMSIKEAKAGQLLTFTAIEHMSGLKFQVQKSEDDVHYHTIGEIEGTGFDGRETIYRYLDLSNSENERYYQIICLTPRGKIAQATKARLDPKSSGQN